MRIGFRTESSRGIGTGHVMRCLTLARQLQARGHDVFFLCGDETAEGLRRQWADVACHSLAPRNEAHDAELSLAIFSRFGATHAVLDSYGLSAGWEQAVAGRFPLLAIDDLGRAHAAPLVLDIGVDGIARYAGKLAPGARGLFGPQYALLRPGVVAARDAYGRGRRLFLSFGGGDEKDMTLRAARLLAGRYADVDIVAGYAYEPRPELVRLCESEPGWRLHIRHPEPAELMAQARLAIGAGGGMTWERLAVGVPSIVTAIAENQRAMGKALSRDGLVRYLGAAEELQDAALLEAVDALLGDDKGRNAMSEAGRALVDGKGALRVAEALEGMA